MDSIIEVVRGTLKGNVVERISAWLGESPGATKRGIDAAIPLSVVALAEQTSTPGRAEELLETLREGSYPRLEADEIDRVLTDPPAAARLVQASEGFFHRVFGARFDGIIDGLARHSGLSSASASKLLGLITPLVLGVLGREVQTRELDAGGLAQLLKM